MATYFVQPVPDKKSKKAAWEVAKKHGRGTQRISDHRRKNAAIKAAERTANNGDSVAVKKRNGQIQYWM